MARIRFPFLSLLAHLGKSVKIQMLPPISKHIWNKFFLLACRWSEALVRFILNTCFVVEEMKHACSVLAPKHSSCCSCKYVRRSCTLVEPHFHSLFGLSFAYSHCHSILHALSSRGIKITFQAKCSVIHSEYSWWLIRSPFHICLIIPNFERSKKLGSIQEKGVSMQSFSQQCMSSCHFNWPWQ